MKSFVLSVSLHTPTLQQLITRTMISRGEWRQKVTCPSVASCSPARSQMAVIRESRTVCDSGDGSGTEEEINKPGCLRADAVSKPTATDLSAQTQRERSEYKCRKGERGKVWETGGWRINNRNSKNHWKDRKSRMRSQLYLLDSIKCRTN